MCRGGLALGTTWRSAALLMKVFVLEVQSLNHQAELVSLVSPVARKTVLTDVIRGEATDLGFGDFEGSLVVDVLVVSRAKVIDDGDGLSHEVHHVLRVRAGHVVLSEDLADALAEDEAHVGDGVLVSKNGANFCCGMTCLGQVKNEGLNCIFVSV